MKQLNILMDNGSHDEAWIWLYCYIMQFALYRKITDHLAHK